MNILFVCTGNTCRSPMAEALMREKYGAVNVKSAGIFAHNGSCANPQATAALAELGIAFDHVSQGVDPQLLEWADVVLTMTNGHKQSLIMAYPDEQNKYFTLKEYMADADKEVWPQLRRIYAEMETDLGKLSPEKRAELLAELRMLEAQMSDYDIRDPFGGPIELYRATLEELDEQLGMLVRKMEDH